MPTTKSHGKSLYCYRKWFKTQSFAATFLTTFGRDISRATFATSYLCWADAIDAIDATCAHAIGVFCNLFSNNNKSFILSDPKPTNQRAELWAAVVALRMARNMFANGNIDRHIKEVVIKSDSAYLVNSIVDRTCKWYENGYINARGVPVANRDLLEELDDLCDELVKIGIQPRFWHVPRRENMQADKLANAALDGIDWKEFDEDDWFEGGEKPYIHHHGHGC